MKNGISSYLSIFDDWNLLKPSLWSVADQVDEIIVVDGAYEWMAPIFESLGRDAQRSRTEVYDVLSSFGKKIRIIPGLWKNESQKRHAGYEACTNRYVLRHDSDEIVFWHDSRVEHFLRSQYAVGQMEMPIYISPGMIRAKDKDTPIERQSFLFDKSRIGAFQHLSYLWLVLPPDEQNKLEPVDNSLICPETLGYTAHLTHWRQPETAINRARFYVLNYVRSTGRLPWLPTYAYSERGGFRTLFQTVPPADFDDVLLGDAIVAAPADTLGWTIRPSPRLFSDERSFSLLHDQMISGLARLNDSLAERPRVIVNGGNYIIDASVERSLINLHKNSHITMKCDQPISRAEARLTSLFTDGTMRTEVQTVAVNDHLCSFQIPTILSVGDNRPLRRTLALTIGAASNTPLVRFQVVT